MWLLRYCHIYNYVFHLNLHNLISRATLTTSSCSWTAWLKQSSHCPRAGVVSGIGVAACGPLHSPEFQLLRGDQTRQLASLSLSSSAQVARNTLWTSGRWCWGIDHITREETLTIHICQDGGADTLTQHVWPICRGSLTRWHQHRACDIALHCDTRCIRL